MLRRHSAWTTRRSERQPTWKWTQAQALSVATANLSGCDTHEKVLGRINVGVEEGSRCGSAKEASRSSRPVATAHANETNIAVTGATIASDG